MANRTFIFLLFLSFLTGCNLASATVPTPPVSQPTVPYIQIAQLQSLSREAEPTRVLQPIPTKTPTPEASATAVTHFACIADDTQAMIAHSIVANVDYATKRVVASQTTRYINRTGRVLNEIVFNVEANSFDGSFLLDLLRVNGNEADYLIQRNTLLIPLSAPLEAGCPVEVSLKYTLMLPKIATTLTGFKGYFGYNERQLNLALWAPTVAAYVNSDWLVHEPSAIGEQTVLEVADWDVIINVSDTPNIVVAAPGKVQQTGETQWRYQIARARDFTISMSPNYRIYRQMARSGVQLELYAFDDVVRQSDQGPINGAEHALTEAVKAFEQFESLFGNYPYSRMLIIQGDFPDGMEFSSLAYVSTAWFYSFDGGVDNFLTVITVHEISHQWWYAQVGNDAAFVPWLDEALSTYSEYIYYEEFYPELREWWWNFRVGWYNPQGYVDSTVYEFTNAREYINAVYLRGVQMLHNVREDIGTDEFFDLLRIYTYSAQGRIATSETFWKLMTPEQWTLTQDTRGQFFREPFTQQPVD